MGLEKYRDLHKWMFIPMILMQLGIFKDYWGDFSDNAWSVHVHYWTGTTWYIYLIIQPYFITRGRIDRHRTNGIIGMFLAGGVCLTALSMLNRDIVNAQRALELPDTFGPFQSWFFFGVTVVEVVMMTAFGYAVIKSIIHRRETENHAWWLISTVFIIIMPALGRGIQNVYVGIYSKDWPNIDIMIPIFISQVLTLGVLLLVAWKYGKLKHPATYLALAVNLFIFLLEPIGRSEMVQLIVKGVFKG
jgi:RsiW-degrading membrane proteinase PrsW (M82 family)